MTMHEKPRRTLAKIIEQYGDELIGDPRRTEALLNDLCGKYTREIFVLVQAQRRRVPRELRDAPGWMPLGTTISRLTQNLENQLALTPEAAAWAVDAWTLALGLREETPPVPWYQRLPGVRGADSEPATQPAKSSATPTAPSRAARPGGRLKIPNRDPNPISGQNAPNDVQSTNTSAHNGGKAGPTSAAAPLSASNASRPRVRRIQVPTYFRKQAPSLLLWTTVFLMSLTLGWAAWNDAPISLGLPNNATQADRDALPTAVATETAIENGPASLPPVAIASQTPVVGHALLNTLYAPPVAARVIADPVLNIRQAPSLDSARAGGVSIGANVTVIRYSPDAQWVEINAPVAGWVSAEFLAFTGQSENAGSIDVRIRLGTGRVAPQRGAALLHTMPAIAATEGAQLAAGTDIIVIATTLNEEWVQIAAPTVGWLQSSAIEFYTDATPAAVGLQP
ncbi:MAG: SH3 domain-containing protein [Litorilinea sp.]